MTVPLGVSVHARCPPGCGLGRRPERRLGRTPVLGLAPFAHPARLGPLHEAAAITLSGLAGTIGHGAGLERGEEPAPGCGARGGGRAGGGTQVYGDERVRGRQAGEVGGLVLRWGERTMVTSVPGLQRVRDLVHLLSSCRGICPPQRARWPPARSPAQTRARAQTRPWERTCRRKEGKQPTRVGFDCTRGVAGGKLA